MCTLVHVHMCAAVYMKLYEWFHLYTHYTTHCVCTHIGTLTCTPHTCAPTYTCTHTHTTQIGDNVEIMYFAAKSSKERDEWLEACRAGMYPFSTATFSVSFYN